MRILRRHAAARVAAVVGVSAALITGAAAVGTHLAGPGSVPKNYLNPAVTQSNIDSTICTPGYTQQIRPPTSFTTPLKRSLVPAQHSITEYELDHLVPLELGGNPGSKTNHVNLWLEPWPDAHKKDQQENKLHMQVCSHQITLAYAQQTMYHWPR